VRALTLAVLALTIGCNDRQAPKETVSDPSRSEAVSSSPLSAPCGKCVVARLKNGECRACAKRYVAGLEVPSAMLYELLDAHGHAYDPTALPCAGCREASRTNALCPEHRWGFAKGQLYFSPLSYRLSHGTPRTRSTLACPTCSGDDPTIWCARCGLGWAGNVSFHDRALQEPAAREYRHLVECIELAETCEMCATAKFSGMKCPECAVEYPRR